MNQVIIRSYEKDEYSAVKQILTESGLFEEEWDNNELLEKRLFTRRFSD